MRVHQINAMQNTYGTGKTKPVAQMGATKRDEVSVSHLAKDYQLAYGAVRKVDDVRADRAAELKMQIQSGTYNVSAKEVCEKIVNQIDLKG